MSRPNRRPPASTPDLTLVLDRTSGVGLARQVAAGLRDAVRSGQLEAGQRLPSTRALAAALGVGRNVVLEAYEDLLAEGSLVGRDRSGTFVAPGRAPALPDARPVPRASARWLQRSVPEAQVEDPRPAGPAGAALLDFRVGQTDTGPLTRDVWRRVWRDVAGTDLPGDYGDPAGDPALRAAVAGYLKRARGVVCTADDVIVTSGALQGVNLIAQVVLEPGDRVGFEEPGYRLARQIFEERGAHVLPLPVDDDGLRLDALPSGPDAPVLVYATPSHQFPLGVRLSLPRREALLAWATRHDALIVEDDYDSEFRYGASPLPALASLDTGGHVVYLGTFSKVLSPAVRVGYVIAPPPLRERLLRLKTRADAHTAWPVQRALTALIEDGHLERHIRRMRKVYAAKRAALQEALAPAGDAARLMGLEAGLHAHLELVPGVRAAQVAQAARARGVGVSPLAPYYRGAPDRNGLVLGFGALQEDEIRRAAGTLAEVLLDALRGTGGRHG